MSAMIKLDPGFLQRHLGLPGSTPLHTDHMGALVRGSLPEGRDGELVVNQRLVLTLPLLRVRRYFALVVPHPALEAECLVAVTRFGAVPPDTDVAPELHLVGTKKTNVTELPWHALVYLLD